MVKHVNVIAWACLTRPDVLQVACRIRRLFMGISNMSTTISRASGVIYGARAMLLIILELYVRNFVYTLSDGVVHVFIAVTSPQRETAQSLG